MQSPDEEFVLSRGSVRNLPPTSLISVNPDAPRHHHASGFMMPPPPLDDALFGDGFADVKAARRKPGRPRKVLAPGQELPKRRRKPPQPKSEVATAVEADNAVVPDVTSSDTNSIINNNNSSSSSSAKKLRRIGVPKGRTPAAAPTEPPKAPLSLVEELDELPVEMILAENALLINAIKELQCTDADKAVALQQQLHYNLMYLLSVDSATEPTAAAESASAAAPT
jgi:hypothetical protein